MFRQILVKNLKYNFSRKPFRWESICSTRTDR